MTERFGTGGFHRGKAVSQHRVEDVDHLPIAIVGAGELAPDPLDRGRQHPVLEGRTVAQGAGFASEHWHIMPGVVDGIAAAEGSRMLGNDASILTDHDAVGIGLNLDRASDHSGWPFVTSVTTSESDTVAIAEALHEIMGDPQTADMRGTLQLAALSVPDLAAYERLAEYEREAADLGFPEEK